MDFDFEQINKYLKGIGLPIIAIATALVIISIVNFNPITPVQKWWKARAEYVKSRENLKGIQNNLNNVRLQEEKRKNRPKMAEKVIFEPTGIQLGAGASFAEPFEEMIDTAKSSKIRIKSIKYNYKPENDPITKNTLEDYNACEMKITAVGTYSQLKNFFSNMLAKPYLSRIGGIRIEPWGFDRSILVAHFNLTLYTYTGR